jgi:hypothetical protein
MTAPGRGGDGRDLVAAEVTEDVLATDDRLDDMRRARLAARIDAGLNHLAGGPAGAGTARTWRRPLLVGLVLGSAGMAAAVALAIVGAAGERGQPRPVRGLASTGDGVGTSPLGTGPGPGLPIAPPPSTLPASPSAILVERELSRAFDRLEVPAGTRVRARLGQRARMTLVGPAEVAVVVSRPGLTEVELTRGRMLADYDGRSGGKLRIHAPGLVAEVVGTLFAVEAEAGGSRVSVAHGEVAVLVEGRPAPIMVNAAQSIGAGTRAVQALAPAIRVELEDHARSAHRASASSAPTGPTSASAPPRRPASASPSEAPSPSAVYRMAEDAMRRRDRAQARRRLEQIVARFPSDRLADTARYELAQLALADGDRAGAARLLETLAQAGRDPQLRESAALARCRLDLEQGAERRAVRCLETFRTSRPASGRDAEALALLIDDASRRGACDDVIRLTADYQRLHPAGPFAREATQRRARCLLP